ncbi:response regulator [Rubrobacter marinus]|nr:response regulator transcription factor [Rubrobacter marinus]
MKRVLIVEDHAVFRQALACVLGRHTGLRESVEAGSLTEALELLPDATVDAAIVDLCLPDGDGSELKSGLRGQDPGIGVLALCKNADLEHHDRALGAGATEVLSKEASIEEILRTVRRLTA